MCKLKVSLVLAVYNGAKYLEEQMDSIRLQTLQPYEVIIRDDVSQDNSVELVKRYIERYSLQDSWRLSVNEENLGYENNFYFCMRETQGDVIFFCDQDDIWDLDKIERMTCILEKNPKIQVLGSEYETFSSDEELGRLMAGKQQEYGEEIELKSLNYHNIFIGSLGCTMCVRRELLERTKKYWFEGWAHDEYVWKMALCERGCYVYHAPTIKRRLHADNASGKMLHGMERRVLFLEKLLCGHEATMRYALDLQLAEGDIRIIQHNIESVRLRIALLKERKWYYTFLLCIKYWRCYHSRKSILMEMYMSIKG